MNKAARIGVVAILILLIGVALAIKGNSRAGTGPGQKGSPAAASPASLPRLVDLGAGKCIPCKMMAPILAELKKEYAGVGRLEVVFIDVWENKDAFGQYGVQIIPTQIFFDASGKELFRHEGFFSKDEILAKWREYGIDLGLGAAEGQPR